MAAKSTSAIKYFEISFIRNPLSAAMKIMLQTYSLPSPLQGEKHTDKMFFPDLLLL